MIGKRLKLSRTAAGLSLRGLQQKIGSLVTAQAIGKYERNESTPGSSVLLALAEALAVPVDYLLSDGELVLEGVDFRKPALTRRKEEARVQALVLGFLERYLTVESVLGLPGERWDRPRDAPFPVRSIADADHAARAVRSHWGLGLDPIPDFVELLEERGIKVLAADLRRIGGLTARVRRPGKDPVPVIVVNESEWGERQRFTLAHELGHLVMHVAPAIDAERAAHRFAGALLMPAESLWAAVGRNRSSVSRGELLELKKLYGVSVQAIAYRCRDLGIFGDRLFRTLFRQFSKAGWRTAPYREPFALPPVRPRRFERLCYRALAEGAVSESKAAELLGVPVHDLKVRMSGRALN
ncbi:MAG TPA: ImmA/IrrE family metallo-endopeptidase [Steroidobacteraceae bacterium]|nr:ImmA/IrrE family metallo-endopeptidase [Steroidobacteraceae bacterium]